ncbi:inositol monophosphatase family protein [Poseidonibacter ostreae]|jgi:myo-inositol-1(or 4)-monophosphatase|uniref:Inositol-1-monophosphatase n=1 Tax=Poseidonibacter ostreae TaxID=2654171 RepID=A0A6L4WRM6_9BACT|nr:inositol monophosphatase family protein [Poseidonibacter ostreae]KAB7885055.1 inositol monophosphatase [Poseidonibacter ostreae]KAB7887883.1 inositol monophosphatase [Poseidonibacter ostreae]KAB7891152.1 inositol monophosphatase [Poseidonibacter ostreae]
MKEKLIEIIKEAGEILKDGYFSKKDVTFKAKKDLVTKYDVAVENFLKESFAKEFSDFNVIAEESDNTNKTFSNSIIVDPIDGTTNFVNKLPHTAISVGVYVNKKPYIGIVYNPILDELYTAVVGEGAYCNGEKIETSDEKDFQKALLSTGFPYSSGTCEDDLNDVIKKIKYILPRCQDIRRLGAASLDLCLVARGVYEGYYEMNLKAWDVSAGLIILQEAGGKVSNLDGNEYVLFENKYIVASNGFIHEELIKNLNI